MSKILTFLDAGVLITAARGNEAKSNDALQIIADPNRVFCASIFLELEVKPKAVYNRKSLESQFYELYFDEARHWAKPSLLLASQSLSLASKYGLGG